MAQAGEGSLRPRPQARRPQKSNCKHQRVSLGPWPPSLSDWRSGRWGGPELHSRLGITGLHFLLEQNNYSLHRGPEFPESNVGRQLRARLRLQKHKLILIRVGEGGRPVWDTCLRGKRIKKPRPADGTCMLWPQSAHGLSGVMPPPAPHSSRGSFPDSNLHPQEKSTL